MHSVIANTRKNKWMILFLVYFVGAILVLASPISDSTFASTHLTPSPVFYPAKNLSNDRRHAIDPAVANNGQNVYVAWSEGNYGILFRMSPDGGVTWNPPLT